MGTDEGLPYGTESLEGWFTIRQGARAHQKSTETIRRWIGQDAPAIRTRYINGVKYVHGGDLAEAAARRPEGSFASQAACAEAGHQPVADADRFAPEGWISMGEACRIARRSKTTLMRWANEGDVRSARCGCGRRRYTWAADMPDAIHRHQP